MSMRPVRWKHKARWPVRLCGEVLEDRRLLVIGTLNDSLWSPLADVMVPSAIATNALGAVFVQGDSFVIGNPSQTGAYVQAFHPVTAAPLTDRIFVSNTSAADSAGGGLIALTADVAQHVNLPLGYANGDLLHLHPNGALVQVRPSTGQVAPFGNLKTDLISRSRGLPVFNTDNIDIFDVASGVRHTFNGTIIPEFSSYNDLAAFANAQLADLFMTGIGPSHPFVMRLRFSDGSFLGAKVLVSSLGTQGGGTTVPGVGVNPAGVVLTTLPVRENADTPFNAAVNMPVAFDFGFSEGNGRAPFLPFEYDQVHQLFGGTTSAGITTDSLGNFVIGKTPETLGNGIYYVTSDLTLGLLPDLLFAPLSGIGIFQSLRGNDVAVSPDNSLVFLTTNLASENEAFHQQVLRVNYPLLPDLTPTHTPDGWETPVVVSTAPGDHSNAPQIFSDSPLFVDFNVFNRPLHANYFAGTFTPFFVTLFLNDSPEPLDYRRVDTSIAPLNAIFWSDLEIPPLPPGEHRLRIVIDILHEQPEINESNNTYETTIVVEPAPVSGAVVGRHLYYAGSAFDGGAAGADGALAPDKAPLFVGNSAAAVNYSNYRPGINGIVIDIAGATNAAAIDIDDFTFRIGTSDDTATWDELAAPSTIVVRLGGGAGGADRIVITWPDGAIAGAWLEVRLLATADTGLPEDDLFYFGSQPGDTTGDGLTNASDLVAVRANPQNFRNPAALDNLFDLNRDGRVNASDMLIVRDHATLVDEILPMITPNGTMGSFAANGEPADVGPLLHELWVATTEAAAPRIDRRTSAPAAELSTVDDDLFTRALLQEYSEARVRDVETRRPADRRSTAGAAESLLQQDDDDVFGQ